MNQENLFRALMLFNLLGALTTPIYYGNQLLNTNPLLWLFVPDCQLSAAYFSIALLLICLKREKEWVTQLGIASAIKYGLWTLLVLLPNIGFYQSVNPIEYWLLILTHVILLLQPLLIIKRFRLSKASIPAFTLLFINDASDYLLGTHPYIPPHYQGFMKIITPLITLGLLITSYLINRFASSNKPVKSGTTRFK